MARWLTTMVIACLVTRPAAARPTDHATAWTEERVVSHALGRPPLREAIEGAAVAERGRGSAANTRPLPQVTYLREQTYGSAGTGEDYVSVAQTIRLGVRPSLRRTAAEVRTAAVLREGDVMRMQIAADARVRFYELLYREARAAAVQAWIERIEEMLAIVARRERGGEAAVYDRKRLERERAVATGRLALERAALLRARARLRAVLGVSATPTITGQLLPAADPEALPTLKASSATRPDFAALDLRLRAATLDSKAVARAWIPDVRLEAGYKGVGMPGQGRANGFMANAMLSFTPRHLVLGLREIAQGEARAARGRRALLATELDGELEAGRAQAVALRQAALDFHEETADTNGELVRIASVGYEGGELGLLEVLDAYRGSADDALTVLDMEEQARRARIELDRISGGVLP